MRRTSLLFAAAVIAGSTQLAFAADMPAKAPVYKAPVIVPSYNWTGFYVGLNAGGSWGHQENDLITVPGGALLFANSDHLNGFIGGGQIGYNWQTDHWVFGIEADFQGSGQKGDGAFAIAGTPASNPCLPTASCPIPATPGSAIAYTDKLDWFGTVRGRVGYAFDRWLPYVTGGWAYGHSEINGTTTSGAVVTAFSASQIYSGWTVGGGMEWAFADHWSAKAEYLYINFDSGPTVTVNATGTLATVSGRMTDNIGRLGVNYKF